MKASSIAILFFMLLGGSIALAQAPNTLRDVLIDESVVYVDEEASENAVDAARKLLRERPQTLRKQNFPKLRQKSHASTAQIVTRSMAAPFGLVWGASINETKNQGIVLTRIGEKDYVNNFSAAKLPKPVSAFDKVDLTFGEENKLWRIIAYGKLLDDDASASKVLREYKIYSALLAKKYGHKQEFFTPAKIDVIEKDAKGKDVTVQKDAPIGNPDFLNQLQQGTATLYSTYYNDEVGAALAINVDGDKKSYIVIDYKNLKILEAQENKTLDAL
ncbi:MAG: hypothetical protein KHX55_07520 [Proteobacteria bacterium]|nr:hypothetical protein [Pseudomonadota bacterium]